MAIRARLAVLGACGGVIVGLLACFAAPANRFSRPETSGWTGPLVRGPFVIRADFPLAGHEDTLDELARLQADLVRILGVPPAKEPIEVYLFHDEPAHKRYMSRYLPRVPYRRALYVKGRGPGRVFAFWSPELRADLRHECTHALLHAALSQVPLWLDEGLAKYFEPAGPERAAAHPYLREIQAALDRGSVSPPEVLESKTDVCEMGGAEYRDAWGWVHFMLDGPPEAREELIAFLKDLQRGDAIAPLSRRLRTRLPRLEEQFAREVLSLRS
jgi:hypothetical protein